MVYKKIIRAIEVGDLKDIDRYFEHSRDMDETTNVGFNPLKFALSYSNIANDVDNYNYTNDDVILYLIKKGFNVNERHLNGQTMLMVALMARRSYNIIHELISAGSDVNALCNEKKSPLIYAIYYHHCLKVVVELIEKGADLQYCDSSGTPLFYAVRYNSDPDIVAALINAGASVQHVHSDFDGNLFMVIRCDRESCNKDNCKQQKPVITILSNNGVDFKHTDNNGNNIIHYSKCFYLIASGIRHGLSIESKNNDGYTPLMSASVYNDEEKVKYLLMCGANPKIEFDKFDDKYLRCTFDIISLLVYHGLKLFVEEERNKEGLGFQDLKKFRTPREATWCFIKNYLLFFNENEEGLNSAFVDSGIKQFINDCIREITKMQETFINSDLTFYDFCLLQKLYKSSTIDLTNCFYTSVLFGKIDKYMKSAGAVVHGLFKKVNHYLYNNSFKDVEIYIRSSFPIYHNVVIMRVKDNHIKQCKRRLDDSLQKIILCPTSSTLSDSDTILPYDCLSYVGRFLSHEMLYKLFLAST